MAIAFNRDPWRLVAIGMAVALVSGCATSGKPLPQVLSEGTSDRTWPPPPSPPRVRLLRAISRPSDLGIERSFWQGVWEFFAGRDDEGGRLLRS